MNIQIDLDDKIVEFIGKETGENIEKINTYIESIVSNICDLKKIKSNTVCVSVSTATKDEIKEINKEYRNIDRATDVLSFPIFERDEIENMANEESDKVLKEIELGDIILCLDIIKEQSIEFGTGVLRETLYMITHGMCHLVGYDHIEDDEKKEMREMEERILNKIGVTNE